LFSRFLSALSFEGFTSGAEEAISKKIWEQPAANEKNVLEDVLKNFDERKPHKDYKIVKEIGNSLAFALPVNSSSSSSSNSGIGNAGRRRSFTKSDLDNYKSGGRSFTDSDFANYNNRGRSFPNPTDSVAEKVVGGVHSGEAADRCPVTNSGLNDIDRKLPPPAQLSEMTSTIIQPTIEQQPKRENKQGATNAGESVTESTKPGKIPTKRKHHKSKNKRKTKAQLDAPSDSHFMKVGKDSKKRRNRAIGSPKSDEDLKKLATPAMKLYGASKENKYMNLQLFEGQEDKIKNIGEAEAIPSPMVGGQQGLQPVSTTTTRSRTR
jgi:hypothetical protein